MDAQATGLTRENTMDDQILTKLRRAKNMLARQRCFYGTLLYNMPFKADPAVETMATDGEFMYYNPDPKGFLADKTITEIIFMEAHECLHPALGHHTRRGSRDPLTWNEAADYKVNSLLEKDGFTVPDYALLNPRFDGWETEKTYATIMKEKQGQPGQGQPGQGQPGQGQPGQGQPGQGQPGQGQPGQGQPFNANVGGCGCVRDFTGPDKKTPSQAQIAQERQRWAVKIAQAAQTERVAGSLSAELEIAVNDQLTVRTPWYQQLEDMLTEINDEDSTFAPPNKRHIWRGIYLPSDRSESLGELAIAVDTSGSTRGYLDTFASNINHILRYLRPSRVHVIFADTKVKASDTYTPEDYPVDLTMHGGGGTRFVPTFEHIQQESPEIGALVYFTDLESPDLGDIIEPNCPVIWAVGDDVTREAPFGRTVFIEQE
jgi:predicted metal-dependent peptidase